MRPEKSLDGGVLRANVAAFAALGAPVAAVVKQDGYGWGAARLARELDDAVESYVVADLEELAALRPVTRRPVRLLADTRPGTLRSVLALAGIPNVSSGAALAEAAAEAVPRGGLTVRVGILDAAGWSTIAPREAPAFAAATAAAGLAVELWTHVTSVVRAGAILADFQAGVAAFERAGVRIVSTDVASTASARRGLAFDRLRIGVGLFGSRLGSSVDTACALRVRAPLVRRQSAGEAGWAGYGDTPVAANQAVAVVRCGYGDGFPTQLAGSADILSVGMQYTVRAVSEGTDATLLVGAGDDVDALAARAGLSAHQLVVGLAPR